ncbi:MAG: hypothetical protein HQ559_08530, partial [Lentisphaerae bacterium]|nr:hypothetical protein [Lentisphaerota bacterium]
VVDCLFSNNWQAGKGGGIGLFGEAGGVRLVLDDCDFIGNTVPVGSTRRGGALYLNSTAVTHFITNCTFVGNNGGLGGGAVNLWSGAAEIRDCYFATNACDYEGGGAIAIRSAEGHTIVADCTFVSNTTARYGGAIYQYYSAAAGNTNTFERCDFYNNAAGWCGGAIAFWTSDSTLKNCAFAGNLALPGNSTTYGGGAVRYEGSGEYQVINCTFYTNKTTHATYGEGGGIQVFVGTVSITNSIFRDNVAEALGPAVHIDTGDTVNMDYCNVDQSRISNQGTFNVGGNMMDTNPLFVAAAAYDLHLKSVAGHWTAGGWENDGLSSALIDAGYNANDDWMLEESPNGEQINMGRYGGTDQASKSPSGSSGTVILLR